MSPQRPLCQKDIFRLSLNTKTSPVTFIPVQLISGSGCFHLALLITSLCYALCSLVFALNIFSCIHWTCQLPTPKNLKTSLWLSILYVCVYKIYYHKFSKLIFCVVSFTYALLAGDSDFSSEYDSHVPQGQTPASLGASLTKDEEFIQPGKPFCASASYSQFMINANEETLIKAGMLHSYPKTLHF